MCSSYSQIFPSEDVLFDWYFCLQGENVRQQSSHGIRITKHCQIRFCKFNLDVFLLASRMTGRAAWNFSKQWELVGNDERCTALLVINESDSSKGSVSYCPQDGEEPCLADTITYVLVAMQSLKVTAPFKCLHHFFRRSVSIAEYDQAKWFFIRLATPPKCLVILKTAEGYYSTISRYCKVSLDSEFLTRMQRTLTFALEGVLVVERGILNSVCLSTWSQMEHVTRTQLPRTIKYLIGWCESWCLPRYSMAHDCHVYGCLTLWFLGECSDVWKLETDDNQCTASLVVTNGSSRQGSVEYCAQGSEDPCISSLIA